MPHEYYSSASVFHATTFCGAGIFPGIIAAFACASDFYFRFLFTCLIFLSYTRLALGRYLNHHLSPRLFRKDARCCSEWISQQILGEFLQQFPFPRVILEGLQDVLSSSYLQVGRYEE